MPPVKDCLGNVIRFVRVAPGEQTCRRCGETVAVGLDYCVRCSDTDSGHYCRDLAPTMDYLRDDEYMICA